MEDIEKFEAKEAAPAEDGVTETTTVKEEVLMMSISFYVPAVVLKLSLITLPPQPTVTFVIILSYCQDV